MSASAFASMAARPLLPTSTDSDTVPSGGVNTGGLDLTAYVGSFVTVRCTADCHVRAAATATPATVGDILLPANERLDVCVTPETKILSVYGDAAGTLYVAKSS